MSDTDEVRRMAGLDMGLAVVSTIRTDGTAQSSVVNGGVVDHPVTGAPVVAFVAVGGSVKVRNLRARPHATVVFRAGWEWVGVEGAAQLVGPDDSLEGFDAAGLPGLLRDVFTAAGGTHDDWNEYDRVMADEGRVVVLVALERVYGPTIGA